MDVDAKSLEMVVFEAAPLFVEEAFHKSMVQTVTHVPRKNSQIASISLNLVHLERPTEVPISNYFLVLEIYNFLLHEKI